MSTVRLRLARMMLACPRLQVSVCPQWSTVLDTSIEACVAQRFSQMSQSSQGQSPTRRRASDAHSGNSRLLRTAEMPALHCQRSLGSRTRQTEERRATAKRCSCSRPSAPPEYWKRTDKAEQVMRRHVFTEARFSISIIINSIINSSSSSSSSSKSGA